MTWAWVALTVVACAGVAVINWMSKAPPDSFSELRRWSVAAVAAGVALAAVGGIVALPR